MASTSMFGKLNEEVYDSSLDFRALTFKQMWLDRIEYLELERIGEWWFCQFVCF